VGKVHHVITTVEPDRSNAFGIHTALCHCSLPTHEIEVTEGIVPETEEGPALPSHAPDLMPALAHFSSPAGTEPLGDSYLVTRLVRRHDRRSTTARTADAVIYRGYHGMQLKTHAHQGGVTQSEGRWRCQRQRNRRRVPTLLPAGRRFVIVVMVREDRICWM